MKQLLIDTGFAEIGLVMFDAYVGGFWTSRASSSDENSRREEAARKRQDAEWYNDEQNFRDVVDAVIEAKRKSATHATRILWMAEHPQLVHDKDVHSVGRLLVPAHLLHVAVRRATRDSDEVPAPVAAPLPASAASDEPTNEPTDTRSRYLRVDADAMFAALHLLKVLLQGDAVIHEGGGDDGIGSGDAIDGSAVSTSPHEDAPETRIMPSVVRVASYYATTVVEHGLLTNEAPKVRAAIYSAVSTLGSAEVLALVDKILPVLDDPDCGVRAAAVQAMKPLVHAAMPEHVEPLIARLTDEDEEVRFAAISVLCELRLEDLTKPETQELLKELVDRPEPHAVEATLRLLEHEEHEHGPQVIAPYAAGLMKRVLDKDDNVRVIVVRLLRRLDAESLRKDSSSLVLSFVHQFTEMSEQEVRDAR